MSFKSVYNAIYDQLVADTTLLNYVKEADFVRGFKESLPARKYMLILEPGQESEVTKRQDVQRILEVEYEVHIYCRLLLTTNRVESAILGNESNKGLLDFVDDVKAAIRKDMSFSYNTYGRSLSAENAADPFDLDATHRYLTVSIDGNTPDGYDAINCGSSTLAGADVAVNIQTALRALGVYAGDGYYQATCTFNSVNNQFTINSENIGPTARVEVSAGATGDASAVLGFESPTEYSGTNIIRTQIEPVTVENSAFPVRYRMIPLLITEETLIGG